MALSSYRNYFSQIFSTKLFFRRSNCLPIRGIGDVVALEIYFTKFRGIGVFTHNETTNRFTKLLSNYITLN